MSVGPARSEPFSVWANSAFPVPSHLVSSLASPGSPLRAATYQLTMRYGRSRRSRLELTRSNAHRVNPLCGGLQERLEDLRGQRVELHSEPDRGLRMRDPAGERYLSAAEGYPDRDLRA